MDAAYLNVSESTGGQLFLLQRNEAAYASLVMSASQTQPSTVIRAVGNVSGSRDLEFPVDSSITSILVMASLQCRNEIRVSRPSGQELTGPNSTQSVDLKAGRIARIDSPESGKWIVRLAGTGLYVLSVLAQTDIKLAGVRFFSIGDAAGAERPAPLLHPVIGMQQVLEAYLSGQVASVAFRVVGPGGDLLSELPAVEPAANGAYRIEFVPPAERFRIQVTGTDATANSFQRTWPVLFRAERSK